MTKNKNPEGKNPARLIVNTPFGKFGLEATPRGLCRVEFPSPKKFYKLTRRRPLPRQQKILSQGRDLLLQYLQGKPVSFASLAVDLKGLTSFERKVLHTLKKVEWGDSLSYSALAAKAGFPRAARAVGGVMRKNRLPIFLPCHRVLRSGGRLGGYSPGIEWKKRLLGLEGRPENGKTPLDKGVVCP